MSSIEALWTVAFGDVIDGQNYPKHGGVAVFETNRVFGGDSAYAYIGTFEVSQSNLTGKANIIRHNDDPEYTDIWVTGQAEIEISVDVQINEDTTVMTGRLLRDGESVPVMFKRFAELPR